MATKTRVSELVEHVLDMLEPMGHVRASRFFSGHQIRLNGIQIAMVMDEELFFRVAVALRTEIEDAGSHPFTYTKQSNTKQSKEVVLRRYMSAPAEWIENVETMRSFAQRNFYALKQE
jgi:DNA transformation protein and related proteins